MNFLDDMFQLSVQILLNARCGDFVHTPQLFGGKVFSVIAIYRRHEINLYFALLSLLVCTPTILMLNNKLFNCRSPRLKTYWIAFNLSRIVYLNKGIKFCKVIKCMSLSKTVQWNIVNTTRDINSSEFIDT